MIIQDGRGTGSRAGVNSVGKLEVRSTTTPILADLSLRNADAGGAGGEFIGVTATGGYMLWLRNMDVEKPFVLHNVWASWNGGDTNHDRCARLAVYFDTTVPQTNFVALGATQLNRSFVTKQLALEVSVWNGVGDGMTVAETGSLAGVAYLSKGVSHFDLEGGIILPTGKTLAVVLSGEEVGNAALLISGAYHSEE